MSRVTFLIYSRWPTVTVLFIYTLFAAGCASVPAGVSNSDPLEPINRKIYAFNDALDRHIVAPVANAYMKVTPRPVQGSISRFYSNLTYPNVFINEFLQGKIGAGVSDAGRFLVNSTIGILGFFDPAKHLGLVAHHEDAGLSLATWGVPSGPYLMVPFVGPDTVSNTPNMITLTLTNVMFYVINPYVTIPLSILGIIDTRVQASGSINEVNQAALDPYIFVREGYLQQREFMIFDGHPPQHFYADTDGEDTENGDTSSAKDTDIK